RRAAPRSRILPLLARPGGDQPAPAPRRIAAQGHLHPGPPRAGRPGRRRLVMTFGRKIAAGYAVALVLQGLVGVAAWATASGLLETQRWTVHTYEVIQRLERLLSLLKDAETGQRGYIITGQEEYLAPHRAATNEVGKVLAELKSLTVDNQS